jgi:hypothetical protein
VECGGARAFPTRQPGLSFMSALRGVSLPEVWRKALERLSNRREHLRRPTPQRRNTGPNVLLAPKSAVADMHLDVVRELEQQCSLPADADEPDPSKPAARTSSGSPRGFLAAVQRRRPGNASQAFSVSPLTLQLSKIGWLPGRSACPVCPTHPTRGESSARPSPAEAAILATGSP